jgi:hypothetical protein
MICSMMATPPSLYFCFTTIGGSYRSTWYSCRWRWSSANSAGITHNNTIKLAWKQVFHVSIQRKSTLLVNRVTSNKSKLPMNRILLYNFSRFYWWIKIKKVHQSHYRPWGFQEVKASRFQDSQHMKVVRLSALHIGLLYPPLGNIPSTVEPRFTNLIRSWSPFVNRNVRKPKLFFP